MTPLPAVSGRRVVRALEKAGFSIRRQRGSHIAVGKPGHPHTISVPDHGEVRPGTLRSIINKAGLTVQEFVELLR
ncbi:MAG: type II toxin-antitoxin system HicA family toxin [Chloroflexi bacterium]|nr:type II toxin-antitoxin system HicA family toxin [Chloroflexota bacterium]